MLEVEGCCSRKDVEAEGMQECGGHWMAGHSEGRRGAGRPEVLENDSTRVSAH